MTYKLDVYEQGKESPLATYESATPFPAIHVGEKLEIDPTPSQVRRHLRVIEVRHVIVFRDGNMVHILGVVCVDAGEQP